MSTLNGLMYLYFFEVLVSFVTTTCWILSCVFCLGQEKNFFHIL